MEDRRPADDVQLVHVAGPVNVAAGIQQRSHDLNVAVGGGPVQRVGVVAGLTRVGVGALLKQESDGLHVSAPGRRVQCGPAGMARRVA